MSENNCTCGYSLPCPTHSRDDISPNKSEKRAYLDARAALMRSVIDNLAPHTPSPEQTRRLIVAIDVFADLFQQEPLGEAGVRLRALVAQLHTLLDYLYEGDDGTRPDRDFLPRTLNEAQSVLNELDALLSAPVVSPPPEVARLREVLAEIVERDDGCQCEHDDDDCCFLQSDGFCPRCWAARALASAPVVSQCEGDCNPYIAPCGARFCSYEEMARHKQNCQAPDDKEKQS